MATDSLFSITTITTTLSSYTSCDISDALLKLKCPNSGFLSDLHPFCNLSASNSTGAQKPIIARVSTVLFTGKKDEGESNIPKDKHWVDCTEKDTFVLISQPDGQKNAVLGGIMASRMKVLGAVGVVVYGRIRDVKELGETGLPIWAKGTSTVGAGGESKPLRINSPIEVDGMLVSPGDILFSDPENGVVIIPKAKVEAVLELLPRLVEADERVKEDVKKAVSVKEAFQKHRSSL